MSDILRRHSVAASACAPLRNRPAPMVLKEVRMPQLNLMFPILPGQKDAHQALMKHILSDKRAEFDERCRRLGVNWERGFYQDTPNGTLFLLVLDVTDPAQFMPKLLEAATPFEQWFMGQLGAIHGLDVEAVKHAPAPEFVHEWKAPGYTGNGKPNTAMAIPVLDVPGWKAMLKTLTGEKGADFAAERARLGVKREVHFLHQTPMGAFTMIALEGEGLDQFGKKMSNPVNAFGEWFLGQVASHNGFSPEVGNNIVLPTALYDYDLSESLATR
jgi:hypothetical protein